MKLVFLQTTCGSTLYTTVFTEGSAAPQTALWRGPEPRFEPGTGESSGKDTGLPTSSSQKCILFFQQCLM